MNDNLVELVLNYKNGDKNAMSEILKTFEPIIVKYSKGLDIYDSKEEFIVVLIEVVNKMILTMLKDHMQTKYIVAYIVRSLRNKRNMIIRKKYNKNNKTIILSDNIDEKYFTLDNSLSNRELELSINKNEREVLKLKYMMKYNDKEICTMLNLSNKKMKNKEILGLRQVKSMFTT